MAIIWPCPLAPSSYVAVGQQIVVPPQPCPSCQRPLAGWGGYWRWLRAPPVEQRIWIRRGRCAACRRTHALLPDVVLVRRLDAVTVIGHGLALKVVQHLGLRRVAALLGVPHTTVRSWWRRFRARAPTLLATCTALAVQLTGRSVQLVADGERGGLEALGVAWQRARVRFGTGIGGLWPFWNRISGGRALGTHTTAPWAALGGAGWMAPSP